MEVKKPISQPGMLCGQDTNLQILGLQREHCCTHELPGTDTDSTVDVLHAEAWTFLRSSQELANAVLNTPLNGVGQEMGMATWP